MINALGLISRQVRILEISDIIDGKYGPYIKAGTKNVSLPEEKQTEEAINELTLEEAIKIVSEAGK